MSALDVFTYADQQIRSVVIDGEGWFVAADVARVLGYRMASDMTRRLDSDEKGTHSVRTPGGEQEVTVISEAGLYVAILGSQIDGAREFKRWVTREVLPAIRRTGQYGSAVALPASFAEALELAAAQAREIEAQEAELVAARPKVEAYDAFMDADGYYSMEAAAKILGVGRTTFFRQLRDLGIIQRVGRLPYQRYVHHFVVTASTYTTPDGVEHTSYTPRVRPAGLDYLRRRLAGELGES